MRKLHRVIRVDVDCKDAIGPLDQFNLIKLLHRIDRFPSNTVSHMLLQLRALSIQFHTTKPCFILIKIYLKQLAGC